ncbi:hypothetical protein D5H75_34870 [Bailinhaonella thermotolerans]|uniref:XRE family transcriptional regulator n=1 Tax=Bailinhaonella thermotolerans TaxID=1070861 RepID=A0A3A4A929_9ACTN|nr:hypothetical protein D5H75_34870 [Bailinhaonella thermotolerans]
MLTLLGGSAVALDDKLLGAVDNTRRRMDDTLASATVSPAMLDEWEGNVASFGRQYMNVPTLRLLCDVLLEFSSVRHALSRRQPYDTQERLLKLAAQLAGLAGILMIDVGDHRLARSFFRTGRTAADETGDRALRAWVTVRESLVPFYYGDMREAINLAQKSQSLAGQTPCAAAAMAPIVEARALAALAGNGRKDAVDKAKNALSRARSAFSQMRPDHQRDAAFGYTQKQLFFHQGDVLTGIGQTQEAEVLLLKALDAYETEWLDPTLIRFDRARCRLLEGDPDEALRLGMEAIQRLDAEHQKADIVLQRAKDLLTTAEHKDANGRAVREFKEFLASIRDNESNEKQGAMDL